MGGPRKTVGQTIIRELEINELFVNFKKKKDKTLFHHIICSQSHLVRKSLSCYHCCIGENLVKWVVYLPCAGPIPFNYPQVD